MSAARAAAYRQAARVIREDGLAKGAYQDDSGAHCTVGALRTTSIRMSNLLKPLADLLGWPDYQCNCPDCEIGGAFDLVTRWNDTDTTTAADVVTLLEQAAEKMEAEL